MINKEVQDKIDFICSRIHEDEWSGTLFFLEEGSFADNDLVIKVQDLLVMDIGNATYTEYTESPDIVRYMMDNELLDCKIGLIHSHNNMNTFFSGTDTATLKSEGLNYHHFVSLIVNNRRTYSAAITTLVKSTQHVDEDFEYTTFNGLVVKGSDNFVNESSELVWSRMKVILEVDNLVNDEITSRLDEIAAKKKAAAASVVVKPLGMATTAPATKVFGRDFTREDYYKDWNKKLDSEPINVRNAFEDQREFFPDNAKDLQKSIEFPQHETVDSKLDYGTIMMDDKIIDLMAKKLVTGSILISETNKLNLKDLVSRMPEAFSHVLPTKEGYEFFIGGLVETLLFNVNDPSIRGFEEDEVAAFAAFDLTVLLSDFPSNLYLQTLIDALEGFII